MTMIRIHGLCIAFALAAAPALAQQTEDHSQHHPSSAGESLTAPAINPVDPPTSKPRASSDAGGGMMQMMMRGIPDQCRAAMQNIPPSCMPMMDKMMSGMTGSNMTPGSMGGAGRQGVTSSNDSASGPRAGAHSAHGADGVSDVNTGALASHIRAFNDAVEKMHEPMMDGVRHEDPDVAFARGMVPHHQAAIDMALVVLKYGKDEKMRKLALDVIREQNREIAEMNEWLRQHLK